METEQLCAALKREVAAGLRETADPAARQALLIEALYELSRSILPRLGAPRTSGEYQAQQAAVAELITAISIPLVRSGSAGRSVAVLAQLAEECRDPQLRKKLSVYAQQLVAREKGGSAGAGRRRRAALLPGLIAALIVAVSLALLPSLSAPPVYLRPQAHDADRGGPAVAYHAVPAVAETGRGEAPDPGRQEPGPATYRQPQPAAAEAKGSGAAVEPVTRVRFAGNQILVPVTLRSGDQLARVELVLDTGATRTAIHESVALRLGIELQSLRLSQSEVADGRSIGSRSARIDALAVGPFSMAPADVEVIPYRGDGVHAGLLGMDFLARHRYQIDLDRELIRWF